MRTLLKWVLVIALVWWLINGLVFGAFDAWTNAVMNTFAWMRP